MTINQDLTTSTSSTAISRTGLPAPAPASSSLSSTLSQSQPTKTEVRSVLFCPQLSPVPHLTQGTNPNPYNGLRGPLQSSLPQLYPRVLISLTTCLPGPSSHMSLLKLLEHATPASLHCCSCLLECSFPLWGSQLWTGFPTCCKYAWATLPTIASLPPPSASTVIFLFLLRT